MRALVSTVMACALLLGASAHAAKKKKKHVAAAGASKKVVHHERFDGGGTGGDSPKPESGGPELLLTFDDGPAPGKTDKVLDLLDQHGYKAVFFVCGVHLQGKSPSADRARALLKEIVKRGHVVGNHTIHHLFLCSKTGGEKAVEEIRGNGALIAETLGEPPYLFRTPYGAHCAALSETLKSIGVRPIGWDIDPQDWRLKNAAKIEASVKAALKNLTGRAILLLHDVQPATIVALPHILDFIDEENQRRAKLAQAPIKVISYDYLLAGRPRKKTPEEEAEEALVSLVADVITPIADWIGVASPLHKPTPSAPAP